MTKSKFLKFCTILSFTILLSACSEARYAAHVVKQIPMPGETSPSQGTFKVGNAYEIQGRRYKPFETYNHTETGIASWYGPKFHGKLTANGEIFDQNELTAAHRTIQMPSIIRVTNLENGRTLILRVNDRGPFAHDRILDVSKRAATLLGFKNKGTAKIRLEVIGDASKEVASRAKQGFSTKGYEVAYAQNQKLPPVPRSTPPREGVQLASSNITTTPLSRPEPVTQVSLSAPNTAVTPQGNIISQPVPLKKPLPVQAEALSMPTPPQSAYASNAPTPPALGAGNFFVQAGSFSVEQNALNFSTKMASYGPSKVYLTRVDNRPYYRVRLGPYNDRGEASRVIDVLRQGGNNGAVIVVD